MKTLQVVQGTDQWLIARGQYRCASDAPVMMGKSKRTTRSEFVRMVATGDEKQVSEWVQKNLLDQGHVTEAAARPFVENMLSEELYPVTGVSDDDIFLASFDGVTMGGKTGFEHKMWNEDLAAAVRAKATEFPNGQEWQLEQQIHVGGLERIIFVVSDGTPERMVWMEYRAVQGRAKQLLDGWNQFEKDVVDFKPSTDKPAPAAEVIPALPALVVLVTGKVTKSNIGEFKTAALARIASIKTDLQTDEDFVNAGNMVKFLADAEEKLKLTKGQALAQTKTIDEVFRAIDEVSAQCRTKRLELDKLVEAEKRKRREEILKEGQDAFGAHVALLNQRLGRAYIPSIATGFADAMKGKKTIAGLRDAVATELARQKIAVNAIADKIGINLNTMRDAGADHSFLFADLAQIVQKENDDFAMLVKSRIAEHKDREAQRAAATLATTSGTSSAGLATAQGFAQPLPVAQSNVVSLRPPPRPSDAAMVAVLAAHYRVTPAVIVGWLGTFDFEAEPHRLPTTTGA